MGSTFKFEHDMTSLYNPPHITAHLQGTQSRRKKANLAKEP
jgi:hypothetical protein